MRTGKADLHRFWLGAAAGLTIGSAALHLDTVRALLLRPWASLLAASAAKTLRLGGQEAAASGTLVHGAGLALNVGESCGALEVVGLYLAFMLAYPVPWRRRLWGAASGLVVFQLLNFLRILSFFWLGESGLFSLFHVYLWPVALVGSACLLWALWLRQPQRQPPPAAAGTPARDRSYPFGLFRLALFGAVAATLLSLLSWFADSSFAVGFAAAVTRGAAWALDGAGLPASAQSFVLSSGSTAIRVLPGCVATPLLALYMAGALVLPSTWRTRALWVGLCLPFFYVLNVARVMLLIAAERHLPGVLQFVYDFYFQLCLLLVLSVGVGSWIGNSLAPGERRRLWWRLAAGYAASLLLWRLAGDAYDGLVFGGFEMVARAAGGAGYASLAYDPNRVLSYLPAFQTVIFLGFGSALAHVCPWRALLFGSLLLYLSQIVVLLGTSFLVHSYQFHVHVRYLRAWVLCAPFVLVWMLWARSGRSRLACCEAP